MNARYLRQLARETEYRHAAMHGYVCSARLKVLLDALTRTADTLDRHERLPLRLMLGACAVLSGMGVAALFLL